MAILNPVAHVATTAQGVDFPWRPGEEEEYAANPKEFLLSRCQLAMANSEYTRALVVCATYCLPAFDILPGGLPFHRSQTTILESLYQGKVGLIIGMGPLAFVDTGNITFGGNKYRFGIGDWVQWDIHAARQFTINRIHCRYLNDTQIIARVKDPRLVY
jgi:hypothetical protein